MIFFFITKLMYALSGNAGKKKDEAPGDKMLALNNYLLLLL